jgi:hypothetical protein
MAWVPLEAMPNSALLRAESGEHRIGSVGRGFERRQIGGGQVRGDGACLRGQLVRVPYCRDIVARGDCLLEDADRCPRLRRRS